MVNENQLNQFLNQMAESGRVEETSLPLTISLGEAFRKLGSSQLPFAEAWVLKLVQAAVTAGAEKLQIAQTSEATTFYFIGVSGLSFQKVSKALVDLENQANPGLQYFATALRALAKSGGHAFSVQFPNCPILCWNGERFCNPEFEYGVEIEEPTLTVSHFSRDADRWRLLPGVSTRMKVKETLLQGAYPSPIPVQFASDPVNNPLGDPIHCNGYNSQVLAVVPYGSSGLSLKLPEWRTCTRTEQIFIREDVWDLEPQTLECQALALLTLGFRRDKTTAAFTRKIESQLLWVKDGVVLERETLPVDLHLGLGILIDANALETDLSGFALRRTPERETLRKEVMTGIYRSLKEMMSQAKPTVKLNASFSLEKWLAVGFCGTYFIDPILVFSGLGVLAMRYGASRMVHRKLCRKIQAQLETLVAELEKITP